MCSSTDAQVCQPPHRVVIGGDTATSGMMARILAVAMTWSLGQSANTVGLSETSLIGEVEDMIWCGKKKDIVLVLTTKNILYRSDNEGVHWTNEPQNFTKVQDPGECAER